MGSRMYRASKGAQQDGEMQEVPGDLKVVGGTSLTENEAGTRPYY